jgi:hypothetical protein
MKEEVDRSFPEENSIRVPHQALKFSMRAINFEGFAGRPNGHCSLNFEIRCSMSFFSPFFALGMY